MVALSIIMPVLNEEAVLADALNSLAEFRRRGAEVIVVDGGSCDRTVDLARTFADQVIIAPRGRAKQMNAGAAVAQGNVLLFLHADTRVPRNADRLIVDGLAQSERSWGRFDVRIAGRRPLLRLVEAMMNLRSRLTGIATGDQAMFVTGAAFTACGGYPDIALMEDVAISRKLKRLGPPLCLRMRAITSGRKWQHDGVLRTIFLMWSLRLSFFFGADPSALARRYGYVPRDP